MSVRVEIVSLDTVDSSGSVVIVTENRRVLVDTGEGTQRLIAEHKIRLSKLAAILITEMHPSKIFGLPGLSISSLIVAETCD